MLHRSQYRRTTWIAVLVCLLLGQAYGISFKAYGPQTFIRSKDAPWAQSVQFSVKYPNTQYTLVVVNGANPYRPVEAAVVRLNGQVVLREKDFDDHRRAVSRPVNLESSNQLSVELRGEPGGAISVEIVGVDNDPPTITASGSPQPNAAGWNNSPVTVTFSCSDAFLDVTCPAPVTVDTQGANQVVSGTAVDSAGLTASTSVTVNLDLTPPMISAVASPAPNSSGWNNSNVVVSFSCGDSLSGVAVCPSPVTVTAEGVSQVNGTAVDKAGNSSQATAFVSVDSLPPALSISSPANSTTVSSSSLAVSGSVSDASSGVASVLCNGAAATFGGGAFSCNVTLNQGGNTVQVVATDAAGNSTSANVNVTLNVVQPPPPPPPPPALNPPPTEILITPQTITLAVGERRSVSATDNLGRSIPASWSGSDSSVLQVNADGSMVALAPGSATVTATYQQLTAQELVTVASAGPLAIGTERWEVLPLDTTNDWINNFVAAQPSAPGSPDMFVLEGTPTGTLVRALAGDGHQLWSTPLLATSVSSNSSFLWDNEMLQAGTPDGGLAVLDSQVFNNGSFNYSQYSMMKVDAGSQAVAWTYNSPSMLDSVLAVHPNGDVYVVQTSNSSTTASAAVLVLNGATGQVKFTLPLPLSSNTYQNTAYNSSNNLVCQSGSTVMVPSLPNHGPLAVLPDGNVYLEVESTNRVLNCQGSFSNVSYSDTLQLMQVQTSGASSLTGLEQFNDVTTQTQGQPGQVLPDGQGGLLAGWNKSITLSSSNQAYISHLLNGAKTDYALPWTSNFSITFVMALGEGGTVYAQQGAFSGSILSFDVASGTATTGGFGSAQIVSAMGGGGAMLATSSQIFSIDANASPAVLSNALGLNAETYYAGGTWLGFSNADSSLEAAVGPDMQAGVTSWPMLAGNITEQEAPPMPFLRHFLPVQPSGQYSVSQFESAMQQGAPVNNLYYALDQASVASFLEQLDKPEDAVAFLGNGLTFSFSGGQQSVGLCFSSDCLEKAASASDPSYTLVSPAGLTSSWVDASLLAGKAKVVFVASADDGAIFEELWGIDATTAHHALIMPPNSSVSLQQAAQVWVAVAQNLVAGETVQNAVANANAQLGTAWTIVGDGTVRIKAVQ
ncbi:MAG TPA: Ig-like domain-containing protein [Terriglobales bacterium]|nr:Ig-like domain-containing protein [Terriglobales bacterium]